MNRVFKDVTVVNDNKIKTIISSVELPGFRKGKAPLNIVKKKYENKGIRCFCRYVVKI